MILTDFQIKFHKKNILQMIDCYEGHGYYEEVEECFEELVPMATGLIEPKAIMSIGTITKEIANPYIKEGSKALFLITTLGRKISDLSSEMFQKNEYLESVLLNAMGDQVLFDITESLKPTIKNYCLERGFGISRRVEPPTGISMEAQRVALQVTEASSIDIKITSGLMYEPLKSMCQIFLLEENLNEFHLNHNCRECPNKECKSRMVETIYLSVEQNENIYKLEVRDEKTLLEILREHQLYMPAICGGRGTCGKCSVIVKKGTAKVEKEDELFFTKEQLQQGYRLACKMVPTEDMHIVLVSQDESKMDILGDCKKNTVSIDSIDKEELIIGIDIGTTTIAMELVGKESGSIYQEYLTMNHQRQYGADVIARIQASNEGKGAELRNSILKDLMTGIEKLTKCLSYVPNQVVIAGNTTMIHLLMGYSCETLGVFPFKPFNIDMIHISCEKLWKGLEIDEKLKPVPVHILPGISAFVGADIVADMLVCDMVHKEEVCMIIDLGTNGELAIGNKDKILGSSTAAGPAFEGGNIICGTGSVHGAICGVSIENGKASVKTIQEKPPVGICGTGAIEGVYELVKEEIVDETGRMDDIYEKTGFPLAHEGKRNEISLYQKDVRELQLAKSAIRAGIETLMLRYGIKAREVSKVYLAGGFGYYVDLKKAIGIGLLPEDFEGKIESIGNGSLQGALTYGKHIALEKDMDIIKDISQEIPLATDPDFNNLYMEHMYFEME